MTTTAPELLTLQNALAGRYAVERLLGRGGMGVVFLARDLALERPVAIKLLAPELARIPEQRERFLHEARAAARLSHPHIVPVHAVEDHGPVVCFMMGYVDGETVGQRVRRTGPMPASDGVRVLREATWALGHAHALGMVHRDVKPDNILLESHTGRALVSDFGLAVPVRGAPGTRSSAEAGDRLGTPAFMSPEQAAGEPVDGRSDLYSLGVTGYFALTGQLPFEGSSDQMLAARLTRPAPSVAGVRPDLPPALVTAVDRCLASRPEDRPVTAEALLELLAETRPALVEAPLPVASWTREAGQVLADVGAATVAATSALGIYGLFFRDDMYAAIAFYPIAVLLYGLGLARIGDLVLRTRGLVSQGYSHDAVRPAVEIELRREAAERLLESSRPRSLTERPGVIALTGAAKTALFAWLATRGIDTLTLIGVAGAVLIPASTLRQLWRTGGKHSGLWGRILQGRLGRLLFRIARVGQPRAISPAADAPTEVFLGDAARRLFEALPPQRRQELAALPDAITRLQAHALHASDGTRVEALVALETIRLDLLRLQAGEVQADQLTRDLDQVEQIRRTVDDRLGRG